MTNPNMQGITDLFNALTQPSVFPEESGPADCEHFFTLKPSRGEVVHVHQTPSQSKWVLETLYYEALNAARQTWQIGFDPETQCLQVWYGPEGEETSESLKCDPEKAQLEARGYFIQMRRRGYHPSGAANPIILKPMKGEKYTTKAKLDFPVACDAVLDGVRLWSRMINLQAETFSSRGVFWLHKEHISEELKELFSYLPHNAVLDGEMWHPELSFSKLAEITRTNKGKHPQTELLEYHIFDIWWVENPPFEVRRKLLEDALRTYRLDKFGSRGQSLTGRPVDLVDSRSPDDHSQGIPPTGLFTKLFLVELQTAGSHQQIQEVHAAFTEKGYKGIMVKRLANGAIFGSQKYRMSTYLFGKGTRILKLKSATENFGEDSTQAVSTVSFVLKDMS